MKLDLKTLYSQSMQRSLDDLCDLSPKDLEVLHEIAQTGESLAGHPSTRIALKKSELIMVDDRYKMTDRGRSVYERALQVLGGTWQQTPYLPADVLERLKKVSNVRVANRIRKHLDPSVENDQVKCAIFLASGPHAYRSLSRIFGFWALDNPMVSGVLERGELICPSEHSISLLTQVVSYL